MASKPKQVEGRLYLGRDESGCEQYQWVGRFATVKERDEAVMRARLEREAEATTAKRPAGERVTCAEYADDYIERMESGALRTKSGRPFKASQHRHRMWAAPTLQGGVRHPHARVHRAARGRPVGREARPQAGRASERSYTLFTLAVDEELIARNPFRGLMRKPKDRGAEAPPTDAEFMSLLKACDVHDDYGPRMRAHVQFCAFTVVRPGRGDGARLVGHQSAGASRTISKRLYRGKIDLPKSNRSASSH